jgi:hypothetical protein
MEPDDTPGRRNFLKGLMALPAWAGRAEDAPAPQAAASPPPALFNAIQMGPHTMLDEGIDRCLDLIQETAGINVLMVYSHTYHGDLRKPPQFLATDHGVPPRDMRNRKLPSVWVRQHEPYFRSTPLRHQRVDPSFEYADRDLFAELAEPARKRGMKLYARILEGSGREVAQSVQGFSQVVTRDINGRPTTVACWNHPDYRAWWNATVEDLFRSYDLDGFQ